MKQLKDLLPQTFHPAVLKQMQADAVCQAAERALLAILPDYASDIVVRYFKDGTLYLGTSSSSLASELRFREKMLITKLHEYLRSEGIVKQLVVRI